MVRRGVLINVTGGSDVTLFEIDAAANRIREEVDPEANIIFGSTYDDSLQGGLRVSVVATGIETEAERTKQAAAVEAQQQAQTGDAPGGGAWFPHSTQRPQPYPAVQRPAPRGAEANPTMHLRAAAEGRREQGGDGQYPNFVPPPAETTGYRPEQAPAGYAVPRGEERSGGGVGLFERMRGFARSHGIGGTAAEGYAVDRHAERRPLPQQLHREPVMAEAEAPVERPAVAPAASSQTHGSAHGSAPAQAASPEPAPAERDRNATQSHDELGDIPAFLRKERVDS